MRVLQVVTDTARRGGQVFATDLHVALHALGLTVRTVALAPGSQDGLPLRTMGATRLDPAGLARLRRLMGTADAVVAHGSTTLPATAIAGCGMAIPVVYRSLGDPMYWATTPRRPLQLRVLLRAMTAVVALWPAAAHDLAADLGVAASRIRVIPNGIHGHRFAPSTAEQRDVTRRQLDLAEDRRVMAVIGSLSHEKGVDVLLDAAARLDPSSQVIVAGDGPLRATLEAEARRLAVDVRFLGAVHDVRGVYAAADCVVMPSRTEGLPAVAIEAGLCEVPVVASDVGGVAEITGPGPGLVPPEDPAALARAIERTLQAGAEAGRALRIRCEARYTIDVVAACWARLLGDVVARGDGCRRGRGEN